MGDKLSEEYENIMGHFNKMTRDDLLLFIANHLYYEEDFGICEWIICADELVNLDFQRLI